MKPSRFLLAKLTLVPLIVLMGFISLIKPDYKVTEDVTLNSGFQKHLILNGDLKEIEFSIDIEENEEISDQSISRLNTEEKIIRIYNEPLVFYSTREHYQDFILFESDNSPPFTT